MRACWMDCATAPEVHKSIFDRIHFRRRCSFNDRNVETCSEDYYGAPIAKQ